MVAYKHPLFSQAVLLLQKKHSDVVAPMKTLTWLCAVKTIRGDAQDIVAQACGINDPHNATYQQYALRLSDYTILHDHADQLLRAFLNEAAQDGVLQTYTEQPELLEHTIFKHYQAGNINNAAALLLFTLHDYYEEHPSISGDLRWFLRSYSNEPTPFEFLDLAASRMAEYRSRYARQKVLRTPKIHRLPPLKTIEGFESLGKTLVQKSPFSLACWQAFAEIMAKPVSARTRLRTIFNKHFRYRDCAEDISEKIQTVFDHFEALEGKDYAVLYKTPEMLIALPTTAHGAICTGVRTTWCSARTNFDKARNTETNLFQLLKGDGPLIDILTDTQSFGIDHIGIHLADNTRLTDPKHGAAKTLGVLIRTLPLEKRVVMDDYLLQFATCQSFPMILATGLISNTALAKNLPQILEKNSLEPANSSGAVFKSKAEIASAVTEEILDLVRKKEISVPAFLQASYTACYSFSKNARTKFMSVVEKSNVLPSLELAALSHNLNVMNELEKRLIFNPRYLRR